MISPGRTPYSPDTLKGQKILVVDDAPDNRFLITHFLRALGPETSEATNGQEALDKLFQEHYDLVVMDLQMPVMDAYQAMGWLRKTKNPPPVIAVTANCFAEERGRCLRAGFKTCLPKPIDRQALLKTVCDCLCPNGLVH